MKKFGVKVGGRVFIVHAKDTNEAVKTVKAHLADSDKLASLAEKLCIQASYFDRANLHFDSPQDQAKLKELEATATEVYNVLSSEVQAMQKAGVKYKDNVWLDRTKTAKRLSEGVGYLYWVSTNYGSPKLKMLWNKMQSFVRVYTSMTMIDSAASLKDAEKVVSYSDYANELEKAPKLNWVEVRNENHGPSVIKMGVNWSALGTVDLAAADKFVKELQKAVEFAKNFKYNGYKISYREPQDLK